MSKLDDILMNAVEEANKYGLRNGEFTAAKQQIKDLVLELIDDTMLYSGGLPDASINLEQIRQKVNEL